MNQMNSGTAFAGRSKDMRRIYGVMEKIAPMSVNVLISGEPGCGKEALARIIHERSGREGAFKVFSPSILPLNIDELQLNEAIEDIFCSCGGGTLLIANIADASPQIQMKLVSLLEYNDKKTDNIFSRVRIIASTDRNLSDLARQGRFSQELCDILGVVLVEMPPLRQRREDIPELADIFLKEHFAKGYENKTISKEAMSVLLKYDWPGNVRELENVIIQAAISSDSAEIDPYHFPSRVRRKNAMLSPKATVKDELYKLAKGLIESGAHLENTKPYEEYIKIVEAPLIQAVMDMTEGNKSLAAKYIKINRNTLSKKLQEHCIE